MEKKTVLRDEEMPKQWYNVVADMPNAPAPPLGPDGKPIGPEALAAIFPMAILLNSSIGTTQKRPGSGSPTPPGLGLARPSAIIWLNVSASIFWLPPRPFF